MQVGDSALVEHEMASGTIAEIIVYGTMAEVIWTEPALCDWMQSLITSPWINLKAARSAGVPARRALVGSSEER